VIFTYHAHLGQKIHIQQAGWPNGKEREDCEISLPPNRFAQFRIFQQHVSELKKQLQKKWPKNTYPAGRLAQWQGA
jgi:hypothetical protein